MDASSDNFQNVMSQLVLAKKLLADESLKAMLDKFESEAASKTTATTEAIYKQADAQLTELRTQSKYNRTPLEEIS